MKKTRHVEIIRYTRRSMTISNEDSPETDQASEPAPVDIPLEFSRALDFAESLGKNDGSVSFGSNKHVSAGGRPLTFLRRLIGR